MIIEHHHVKGPVKKRKHVENTNDEDEDPLYARQKPDIVSPGVKIFSAYSKTNDSFTFMSGTSMATPALSGVVALVMSALDQRAEQGLNYSEKSSSEQLVFSVAKPSDESTLYDLVYNLLTTTAKRDGLGKPIGGGGARVPLPGWPVQQQCEHRGYDVWPNMFYGHGLVDAEAAVMSALGQ
jgi:subtilisin family serine protease